MVKNPFTNKDIGILTQFVRFKTLTDNRKQELLDEL